MHRGRYQTPAALCRVARCQSCSCILAAVLNPCCTLGTPDWQACDITACDLRGRCTMAPAYLSEANLVLPRRYSYSYAGPYTMQAATRMAGIPNALCAGSQVYWFDHSSQCNMRADLWVVACQGHKLQANEVCLSLSSAGEGQLQEEVGKNADELGVKQKATRPPLTVAPIACRAQMCDRPAATDCMLLRQTKKLCRDRGDAVTQIAVYDSRI